MPEINLLDQTLVLLPEKAVLWKEKNILLAADVHLGKTSFFRSRGMALPGEITSHDLARLSLVAERANAEEILIAGDLFHTKSGLTQQTLSEILEWRKENRKIKITLVQGNHDKRSGNLSGTFDINYVDDLFEIPPFLFNHKPAEMEGKYIISGHVHPAVRLSGPGRQREKLPCFYFGKSYAVLPSFGSFTGSFVIEPKAGDRVFVIADDEVIEVNNNL